MKITGAMYLGANLRSLLGVHHAHMLKVLQGVLPVLLLSTHVLLQQTEYMTWLQRKAENERKAVSFLEQNDEQMAGNYLSTCHSLRDLNSVLVAIRQKKTWSHMARLHVINMY